MRVALGSALSTVLVAMVYHMIGVTGWLLLLWTPMTLLVLFLVVIVALAYSPNGDKIIKQIKKIR